jgi:hypothetical protein
MITSLIWLFVAVVVIGVLFWAANRILAVIPIEEPFRTIAYVLLVLIAVAVAVTILIQIVGAIPGGFPRLALAMPKLTFR